MNKSIASAMLKLCIFLHLGLNCAYSKLNSDQEFPEVCPQIISKIRWGARTPLEIDYQITPVENVVIHHTVTGTCSTENECATLLRNIQNFHMENLEFHDIGYNFMVGGDGQIYEGVGWHKIGAHTRGYNSRSVGIAFIGNFKNDLPNQKQIKAVKDLLECGEQLGELSENFKLFGARQVSETESPGLRLYRKIQDWPHWTKSPPK